MAKYLDTLKDMVNAPEEIAQAPAEQWLKDRISMKEGLGDMSEANLTNAEAAQMLLDYEAFKEKNREEWRANPASERQLKALEDRGIEIQKQLTMGEASDMLRMHDNFSTEKATPDQKKYLEENKIQYDEDKLTKKNANKIIRRNSNRKFLENYKKPDSKFISVEDRYNELAAAELKKVNGDLTKFNDIAIMREMLKDGIKKDNIIKAVQEHSPVNAKNTVKNIDYMLQQAAKDPKVQEALAEHAKNFKPATEAQVKAMNNMGISHTEATSKADAFRMITRKMCEYNLNAKQPAKGKTPAEERYTQLAVEAYKSAEKKIENFHDKPIVQQMLAEGFEKKDIVNALDEKSPRLAKSKKADGSAEFLEEFVDKCKNEIDKKKEQDQNLDNSAKEQQTKKAEKTIETTKENAIEQQKNNSRGRKKK